MPGTPRVLVADGQSIFRAGLKSVLTGGGFAVVGVVRRVLVRRLAAQGLSNREIGAQIRLSENTVKGHVAEILGRLSVRNRVEATLLASSRGWL